MNKIITNFLFFIFMIGIAIGCFTLFSYLYDNNAQDKQYEDIRSSVAGDYEKRVGEYENLKQLNDDMVGWIRIKGCKVDYPILQTPKDQEAFYLGHNFQKEKARAGSIFISPYTDIEKSDNITIFGHKMAVGTMFGQLEKYKDLSFYKKNKYIYLDTFKEPKRYQVAYVFTYNADSDPFKYYEFVDSKDDNEMTRYLKDCEERSLYSTGTEVKSNDKLITLSTCEYSSSNGRLVIVGKEIKGSSNNDWRKLTNMKFTDRLKDVLPMEIMIACVILLLIIITIIVIRRFR